MRYRACYPIYKKLYLIYEKKNRMLKRYSDNITRQYNNLERKYKKARIGLSEITDDVKKDVKELQLSLKCNRISTYSYISVVSIIGTLFNFEKLANSHSLFESIAISLLTYLLILFSLWFLYILWVSFLSIFMASINYDDISDNDKYHLTGIISFLLSPVFVVLIIFILYGASKG